MGAPATLRAVGRPRLHEQPRLWQWVGLALCAPMVGLLVACGPEQGVGFDPYPSGAAGEPETDRLPITWTALPPIPTHQATGVETAKTASEVLSYRSSPTASVSAASAPNTWLRIVDAGDAVWLVAEAEGSSPPGLAILRTEVIQRSGCLISGAVNLGAATVFRLNCR